MRRLITLAASAASLLAAIALGPLGAAASPPYVYGCTPATYYANNTGYLVFLSIYNGSAATANLTHKVLAGDGTNLNAFFAVTQTSTLPPTHTSIRFWTAPGSYPLETNNSVPASVRIVSDVPVAATLNHNTPGAAWQPVDCKPFLP